jgi:toxin-antitoxin system PIN domain toxin
MNLIDANLLLYAYDESSPQNEAARAWLEQQFSGVELVALPWQSITAFLRISTNPRAYLKPFTLQEAALIVSEWLGVSSVTIPVPTERHWDIFRELLVSGQASGPLAMDAHLAALALEHGAVLCTTDRDFSRFQSLRVCNPLTAT